MQGEPKVKSSDGECHAVGGLGGQGVSGLPGVAAREGSITGEAGRVVWMELSE